jgi:hypothetical protein
MANIVERLFGVPFSWRQRRLARFRSPLTESDFVKSITEFGGDRMAAVVLWRRLKDWTSVRDFTPYPGDSLGFVFGIAEEELDEDLILDVLKELAVPIPTQAQLSAFGPIDTPLRIAQLVAFCRRSTAP